MPEVRCKYRFRGFEAEYNPPPETWKDCECVYEDGELIVTSSQSCVMDDGQSINEGLAGLQYRMDCIGYYLMFKGNPSLTWSKDSQHDVIDDHGRIVSTGIVVVLDSASAFIRGRREFPDDVPSLSPTALKNIHIYVFANRLEDQRYIGDRIRSFFNILEERWAASGRDPNSNEYNDVRLTRNFVSHPHCRDPEVVAFVRGILPQAVKSPKGNEYTEYDPSDVDHRNAVSKCEVKARQLSFELISELLPMENHKR